MLDQAEQPLFGNRESEGSLVALEAKRFTQIKLVHQRVHYELRVRGMRDRRQHRVEGNDRGVDTPRTLDHREEVAT